MYFTLIHHPEGLPPCGIVPHCAHINGGHTPNYNPLCANDIDWPDVFPYTARQVAPNTSTIPSQKDDSSFKWDAWKYSTIGLGAATLAFGTVAAVFVVKSIHKCIRSRNEIQIELIDDPALGHTLLQNQQN
jgi:hypothetical protein